MVNMTYVNLSQNHFVEATFYPLRSWYGSHLSVIKLNNCWLGKKALSSLAEIIRESPSLKTLYLSNNHLGEESFQIICDALSAPKSHLESLDVSNNNFDDAGITKIAKALKTNKALKSLNLSENNFVYDGALSLIDSLNTNKTLKKLGLVGVILRENLKQRLTEKVVMNRAIIAQKQSSKLGKRKQKLTKKIKSNKRTREDMEDEVKKILVEKEEKMKVIHESGDKLTEIMDADRLKWWTKNKELKELRQTNIQLATEEKDLDRKIYPVERRFYREKTDWEFRIDDMRAEQKRIKAEIEKGQLVLAENAEQWKSKRER